jgi:hypothetical protein
MGLLQHSNRPVNVFVIFIVSSNFHIYVDFFFLANKICLPSSPLESLRATVLVRVVLISTVVLNVLLVVHALGVFLCLTLRLFAVEPVLALCFRETVDLSTCITVY